MYAPLINYESRQLHTQVIAFSCLSQPTERQGSLTLILSFACAKIEARLRSL